MRQLNDHHSFTGMQRDMTVSKHPSSFLYDAHNIRLTARGEDTLLTITNERGPRDTNITISGTYLGHCLLGDYLVVFSTESVEEVNQTTRVRAKEKYIQAISVENLEGGEVTTPVIGEGAQEDLVLPWEPNLPSTSENTEDGSKPDYITRIDLSNGEVAVLYNGDLEFSILHPIEAIAFYENSNIQKVYWTDGYKQPRVINIVGNILEEVDSQFDFVRELSLKETVHIQKQLGASGSFAPGVIQYALTYYSKYGQESNIFYTSPLLYISHKDRGGSPEDRVENAFKITVETPDRNFDYLRIYSIQRTSVNGTPIVKRVQDIAIKEPTTNTVDKTFDISVPLPSVLVNGAYILVFYAPHTYLELKSLLGYDSIYWFGYLKSKYPNLVIKTQNGYVTWGNTSTNSSVLWVSSNRFTDSNGDYGYHVCETPNANSTNIEPIAFSTEDIVDNVSFLDTGVVGDSIDPTELLFKGGESIVAETIEQKDNTLFLGNINLIRHSLDATLRARIAQNTSLQGTLRDFYPTKVSDNYIYYNQLTSFSNSNNTDSVPCGGFKSGDYYRCGIQFQYKDGRWSDPVWINDIKIANRPEEVTENGIYKISVPAIEGTLNSVVSTELYDLGYRKARAVVVFPEAQDRVTICQGVLCPTMYTNARRNTNKDLYAQSSWFFRPNYGGGITQINNDGSVAPTATAARTGTLTYTSESETWNPANIRQVEIQGDFSDDNDKFNIDSDFTTLHSPDIEFDDTLSILNFTDTRYRTVGSVTFTKTFSDIDIQTETPTISNSGGGFQHKAFIKDGPQGIVSGLFYDDYLVDDAGKEKFREFAEESSSYKWLVYPWNRSGSLNNDINRPANAGTRTALLKKKVISNLRYTNTTFSSGESTTNELNTPPQIFNSDQLTIVKVGDKIYQGNIDTLLSPTKSAGMYFAFAGVITPFNSTLWWRTSNLENKFGLFKWMIPQGEETWKWVKHMDNETTYPQLAAQKEYVRMRYKSSPHMVLSDVSSLMSDVSSRESKLPIIEIIRYGDGTKPLEPFYRATMFGGISEDALKANIWIPCGEPIELGQSYEGSSPEGNTIIQYSYGDTYYQRWDCLKTYPFTSEDINQIVEIGSFMLETRVNIDGRYDRNRGQVNNLNMTPQNFNLLNPVYSQINNFFTYRILDEAYYNINSFPNQITWTKEKKAGADVDLWTNVTLTSTYDMDGSKGAVVSLNTWKDQIFCFQDTAISNILFNSRVQIPTSDGVPIEISNGYKVDGYRYISNGIGCINKWTISNTPSGLYFIDSTSNHLYHVSGNIQDVTIVHNMTSWFNNLEDNEVISTLYDNINHDLYLLTNSESLCYSEILGQFTSFMDYDRIALIESNNNYIYTMRDGKLYWMFKGLPNNFFGNQKGWDFSFISNGVDNSTMDFDKIFGTIDYRMDMFDGDSYEPDKTFDYIQVNNEYQDTGEVPLSRLKIATNPRSYHQKGTNLQKKFRIWRIQIPRNKNSLDRIRNPWCKIKLGSNGSDNLKAILHDLNVQYYL